MSSSPMRTGISRPGRAINSSKPAVRRARARTAWPSISSTTYANPRIETMSGKGFHVHGPHEHELEHAAQHEPKGFAGKLAVITAILATVGAFFSYTGGVTQVNAALYKNDAA